jgi:hypothetical protein
MKTDRRLRGVLETFLGTYTSRYSDYRGYWLFGFLCPAAPMLEIDLLGDERLRSKDPVEVGRSLAVVSFAGELRKSGLPRSHVTRASLLIETLPAPVERVLPGGTRRRGNMVLFEASADSDHGNVFVARREVFVSPHDPNLEFRRPSLDAITRWTYRD